MSAGAVIFGCNFDHKGFARNNGLEIFFPNPCGKTHDLSGEQGARSIGDFYTRHFVAPHKYSPFAYMISTGNWPEIFDLRSEIHHRRFGGLHLIELPNPSRIFFSVGHRNAVFSDIWSISKFAGDFVNAVGLLHRFPLSSGNGSVINQSEECGKGNSTAECGNNIESLSHFELGCG